MLIKSYPTFLEPAENTEISTWGLQNPCSATELRRRISNLHYHSFGCRINFYGFQYCQRSPWWFLIKSGPTWTRTKIDGLTVRSNNLYTIEPYFKELSYIVYYKYMKYYCNIKILSRRQDSNLHLPGSRPDRFMKPISVLRVVRSIRESNPSSYIRWQRSSPTREA